MQYRLLARLALLTLLLIGGSWLPASRKPAASEGAVVPVEPAVRMGEHRFVHSGGGDDAVAFSSDGRRIISSDGFSVRVWDCATGELLREFPASTRWLNAFAVSHDDRIIAIIRNR